MFTRTVWAASQKTVKLVGNSHVGANQLRGRIMSCSLPIQIRDNSSTPSMGVKTFVDGLLKSYKVVVFAKSYCPYCKKTKAALEAQHIKPGALEWINIDGRNDCSEIQDYLQSITGARSVPRVFIDQKFFGGGDDTTAAADSGKLAQLLKEIQAV
uniref:Glutaredoxin-1 n=1 Tax=Haemonchus contortus TaxID=6289 RepID=A0A7I5E5V1_HAECO